MPVVTLTGDTNDTTAPGFGVEKQFSVDDGDVTEFNVLWFGRVSNIEYHSAIRFKNVPVDMKPGTVINSVTLQLFANADGSSAFTGRFRFERTASPADIVYCTNSCANITSRTFTTATVQANTADFSPWTLSQYNDFSRDLKTILQEVVDNHAIAGSAIFLFWENLQSDSSGSDFKEGDVRASGQPPKLVIDYTPPGSGGPAQQLFWTVIGRE